MKVSRAMILSAGAFALTAAGAPAQTAATPAVGQKSSPDRPGVAAVIAVAPVPAATVSHSHPMTGGGAAVSETCTTCPACVKEYVPKMKAAYQVETREYCVPKVSLLGLLLGRGSSEEMVVKTRKVLIVTMVPNGTTPKFNLAGGQATGGPVSRTPQGSAETTQPGASTEPGLPFQSVPSGGRTPAGAAETIQPGK